jgi:phosphoenolpyruvate carboxykinase (GTP)
VLEWVLDRCNNRVNAMHTPIGYTPYPFNIDLNGIKLSNEAMDELLRVDKAQWLEETKGIRKFFGDFKKDMPKELWQEYDALLERLKKNE